MFEQVAPSPFRPRSKCHRTGSCARGKSPFFSTSLGVASACGSALLALFAILGKGPLFWGDSYNHLWLISAVDVRGFVPPYTVSGSATGLFLPHLAFYGGSLYWCAHLFGLLVGSFQLAFTILTLAAFVAAYSGIYSVARHFKCPIELASLAGFGYLCSPYILANFFGRGAWPEFVATSFLPLVASSLLRLQDTRRVRYFILLIVSMAVVTGSHVITAVLSSGFLLLGLVLLTSTRKGRKRLKDSKTAILCLILGTSINAWWLLPMIWYRDGVFMAERAGLVLDSPFTSWSQVLSPTAKVPLTSTTPHLHASAPVWVLLSVAISVFIASAAKALRLTALSAFLGGTSFFLVFAATDTAWAFVPSILHGIQFPYRTLTYFSLWIIMWWIVLASKLTLDSELRRSAALKISRFLLLFGVLFQATLGFHLIYGSHRDALELPARSWSDWETPSTFYFAEAYRFTGGTVDFVDEVVIGDSCSPSVCVTSAFKIEKSSEWGVSTQLSIVDSPFIEVVPEWAYLGRSARGFVVVDAQLTPAVAVVQSIPKPAQYGIGVSLFAVLASLFLVVHTRRIDIGPHKWVTSGIPRRRQGGRASKSRPTKVP